MQSARFIPTATTLTSTSEGLTSGTGLVDCLSPSGGPSCSTSITRIVSGIAIMVRSIISHSDDVPDT